MTQAWRAELRLHNVQVMYVAPSEVTADFANKGGGNRVRGERVKSERKIQASDIAQTIRDLIALNDRVFVTEVKIWATNPN